MTKHNSFGVSCCSTGVNQDSTLPRFDTIHNLIDYAIINLFPKLEECFPRVNARVLADIIWNCEIPPSHNSFYLWKFVQNAVVKFELGKSVNTDDLGLRMLSLVVGSLSSICGVNSTHNVVVEHGTLI